MSSIQIPLKNIVRNKLSFKCIRIFSRLLTVEYGGKLKETGNVHWDEPNTGATNETGFTAFGSG